ncbi:hypothetical protein Btru_034067 [Bulinus truncatus]|nr:hypothetical protein Btru_034067 [Bulinus truncatus]
MALDDLFIDIGGFNKFQILIFIGINNTKIVTAWSMILIIFAVITPKYICITSDEVSETSEYFNGSSHPADGPANNTQHFSVCHVNGTSCVNYLYLGQSRTIVSEIWFAGVNCLNIVGHPFLVCLCHHCPLGRVEQEDYKSFSSVGIVVGLKWDQLCEDLGSIWLCGIIGERFGRRKSTIVFLWVACIASFGCLATEFTASSDSKGSIVRGLSLDAKMGVAASWVAVQIWVGESYPTVTRSLAYGFMNTAARDDWIIASYVIMGCLSLVTGLLLWVIPETLNQNLKDSTITVEVSPPRQDSSKPPSNIFQRAVPRDTRMHQTPLINGSANTIEKYEDDQLLDEHFNHNNINIKEHTNHISINNEANSTRL